MPFHYEDFDLSFEPDGQTGWTVVLLRSPMGGGSAPFRLELDSVERERLLAALDAAIEGGTARDLGQRPEAAAPPSAAELGERLHSALLGGRVRERWIASRARLQADTAQGLRLRLVFSLPAAEPGQEESDEQKKHRRELAGLASLPWELLFDAETRDFLSRDPRTPLVRHLDVTRSVIPPPAAPPLAILLVAACPKGLRRVDFESERDRIVASWKEQSDVTVETLPRPTLQGLRNEMHDGRFHVLHFMGHGAFDGDEGGLWLEDDAGEASLVPGAVLAEAVKGLATPLQLAVLSACNSAEVPRREGTDLFSAVATALVLADVPAVVAMQFVVTDWAATAFSGGLYRALAAGDPLEAAVAEGRVAVYLADPGGIEWATPALYLRAAGGQVLQQVISRDRPQASIAQRLRDFTPLIEEKTTGFVGRRFVVEAIEEFCFRFPRGYFSITGEPGIGKTAVAAELVRRNGWLHHFVLRREGSVRPETFLANLCAQIVLRYRLEYSTLPVGAEADGAFLRDLFGQISRRLHPGERCVFLVDALDEADGSGLPVGVNPLCLPPLLPPGIFAVLTSRPLDSADGPRFDCEQGGLTLDPESLDNQNDVRAFIEDHLGRPGIRHYLISQSVGEDEFVAALASRSRGNFMYLRWVLPALADKFYRERPLGELPSGLRGYYEDHWVRMRGAATDGATWLDRKLPVLGALAVAPEPLAIDVLAKLSGVGERRHVREVLREWRPFLRIVEVEAEGRRERRFTLYHESFRDFLSGKDEVADERERIVHGDERLVLAGSGRRMVEAYLAEEPTTNESYEVDPDEI